jgi:hypothetical protein
MTKSSHYAAVLLAILTMMVLACSSDSEGVAGESAGGEGSQPAAASVGESALMLDTPEYKIQQEFPLSMELTSTVFNRIRRIPIEYTCTDNEWYPTTGEDPRFGEERSPPLAWTGAPEGTRSFAIIADDPDAAVLEKGVVSPRVHWVIWNIPADFTELAEGVATTTEVASLGPNARQGANDYRGIGYGGPCPPPNITNISKYYGDFSEQYVQKPHGYVFKLYALDTELDLAAGADKNELLQAMEGHILAGGELTGEYINKKLFK